MPTQDATNRHNVTINVVPDFVGALPKGKLVGYLREYIRDFNSAQAAQRAGYSIKWSEAHGPKMLRKYSDYIVYLQKIHAVENAKYVSMEQEEILAGIAYIARANIQDYFTMDTKTITEKLPGGRDKKLKVSTRRWKNPEELTREQAAAVKRVVMSAAGEISDYVLYDKDSSLISIGRHLGLFSEKVILEHRHRHLHAKVDLSNMPLDKLLSLEQEFLQYVPEHQREAR